MPTVTFDFRARNADSVRKSMQSVLDGAGRGGAAGAQRQAASEQAITRATLREIAVRVRARDKAANDAKRAAEKETAATAREAGKREKASEKETNKKLRAFDQLTREANRMQESMTRAAERGAQRRAAAEERANARVTASNNRRQQGAVNANASARTRSGALWGGRAQAAVSATLGVAGDIHGQIQDARQRRAQAGTGITDIFRGAGGGVAEMNATRTRFAAEAEALGMRYEDLVASAAAVQQGSSFFSQTESQRAAGLTAQQSRAANFDNFFRQVRTGRDVVGQAGVGQFVRIGGILQELGLDQRTTNDTQISLARLGEMGAIELSSISKEGMQPIMARVGQSLGALGAGATQEQRSSTIQRTITQAMAEMEVMRGAAGYNPRNAGQIMAALGPALQNPVVQQKMRTNILNAGGVPEAERRRIESTLFEDDPTRRGQRRLRANLSDPVAFAAAAGGALQNNPTLMRNIFAGGGHGNAQGLQANWRNLMAAMFTPGDGGETGYQRISRFTREAGGGFDAAEMTRRQDLAEADPLTALNRQQESHERALTENTGAIGSLSNAFAAWAAQNPLSSTLAGAVAPGVAGLVAGRAAGAAGAATVGSVGSTVAGGGAAAAGAGLGSSLGVGAAAVVGLGAGDLLNDAIMRSRQTQNRDGSVQDTNTFSIFNDGLGAFVQELRGVASSISGAVSGAVSGANSHAAVQAAGVARADEAARQRRT